MKPNMALNLAPFGRWTLRNKAAQRRLALRWGAHCIPLSPTMSVIDLDRK